jgi:hypothetical protein
VQNDYREQYRPEAWAEQTDNGKNIILPEDMDTAAEFYSGTKEERRFRYLLLRQLNILNSTCTLL